MVRNPNEPPTTVRFDVDLAHTYRVCSLRIEWGGASNVVRD